jgi:hypothetical protein
MLIVEVRSVSTPVRESDAHETVWYGGHANQLSKETIRMSTMGKACVGESPDRMAYVRWHDGNQTLPWRSGPRRRWLPSSSPSITS